jgi:O-antigen/teichoic acid export membrane protein
MLGQGTGYSRSAGVCHRCLMEPVTAQPPSLRSSFLWTAGGNAANGLSQWAVLSVLAKLGSAEMLGEYALAVAVTLPVAMLAHLNMRAVLATDVTGAHSFADYRAARFVANAAAAIAFAVFSLVEGGLVGAAVFLLGISLLVENTSDLLYAVMQKRDRMDLIAKSMILRSALSIVFVAAAVSLLRDVAAACAGLLLSRVASLVLVDRRYGRTETGVLHDPWGVLRTSLPLGFTLLLISLTTNVPRYAIERFLGTRELGIFAAVASFVALGSTLVNALGQSVLTRLAKHFATSDYAHMRRLAWQLAAFTLALSAVGTALAASVGRPVLRLLYRPEFAEYNDVLAFILAAAGLGWTAAMLGYVTTGMRMFKAQTLLVAAAAATSAIVSYASVPSLGLYGGALAIGSAGAVQLIGQVYLLSRAL